MPAAISPVNAPELCSFMFCAPRRKLELSTTLETSLNAVKGGLAGSTVLNAKAPMVIARNFKPGFRIELHEKDLRNALLAAESMKVALPLTSLVQQMLISLINEGKGGLDHSAIVTFIEHMAGIEVKRNI